MAVERFHRRANAIEIELLIGPAQLMILQHMIVEAEFVEKSGGPA
ncbi:hypothetical protein [Methylosinus sporium]